MATTVDDAKAVREAHNYNVNVKSWIEALSLEKAKGMATTVDENKNYMKADSTIRKYMKFDKDFLALEVFGQLFQRYFRRVFGCSFWG